MLTRRLEPLPEGPSLAWRAQYRLPAFMKEWATTPRGALLADQSFWRPDAILAGQGLMRFQVFARLCGLNQKAADASKTRHYEWTKFGKLPEEDLDFERLEAERLGEMAVPINPRWVQLRYMTARQRAAWLRFWQGKKQATHWPDEQEVAELLAELARFAPLAREHLPEE